jgi:pimeloyl-ACP methyl ester carboxylesterase
MPFAVTDDDCEIYYEVHGKGPAVAFISGFMGITDIWHAQIDAFEARYRCIAFDTRGAGRSEKPLPRVAYGVRRHARDLITVLDKLEVPRVVLIGHSMGGNIALEAYAAHSERVAGIIFVGSYVAGSQIITAGNRPELLRAAVRTPSARIDFYTSVGLPAAIATEATKWPLYALLGNAESFLEFDGLSLLSKVRVPCLILHGDRDIVSPSEPCATGLKAGLPNATLIVLGNVNHCPMVEDPATTNQHIDAFLSSRLNTAGDWL